MISNSAIQETAARWYSEYARPLLKRLAPDRIKEFDDRLAGLQKLFNGADESEVAVCFLGAAGVGKSTLLNSLVSPDKNVLPHGGIGSLTAQATVIRHADEPYLQVEYFPKKTLRGVLLVLETSYSQQRGRTVSPDDLAADLTAEEISEADDVLPRVVDDAANETLNERLQAYWRQVRLMIQGDQRGDLDMPYLLDGLRLALGLRPRWDSSLATEDAARAARLREYLNVEKDVAVRCFRESDVGADAFLREVRDHASGFLAPNIRNLELGWNATILRDGIALVDLPGIGIANDEYRRVTHDWIAKKARAIVLVVGARGVTESDADLLRRTGFFTHLLHDGDDQTVPPVTLAVVVVRVDDAATASWQTERATNRETARKWIAHFEEQCTRAKEMVRGQVAHELSKLEAAGAEAMRPEREQAMKRVLASLQVHPVSAPQYRALHVGDEEDPAKIKHADESNIPNLSQALLALGEDHRRRHAQKLRAAIHGFIDPIRAQLELDRATWQQDARAEREAASLREELDAVLEPLRRELESRQGAFRELLRNGIPEQIEARLGEATLSAQRDITSYLGRMSDVHWGSLRATINKGGSHRTSTGRHLDLPNELTLRFEEPIAIVWSKHILTSLRRRTGELGDDYVNLVAEVVKWAKKQDARVSARVVEKLHESLAADVKGLNTVGKEAVDELKKKVRDQLSTRIQSRVHECCKAFVDRRANEGPGVKRRILEFFKDELAQDVTSAATPVAKQVLKRNYDEVQSEIVALFESYKNPLDRARDALVLSHEETTRRSDAQRRRKVLDDIAAVLERLPEVTP